MRLFRNGTWHSAPYENCHTRRCPKIWVFVWDFTFSRPAGFHEISSSFIKGSLDRFFKFWPPWLYMLKNHPKAHQLFDAICNNGPTLVLATEGNILLSQRLHKPHFALPIIGLSPVIFTEKKEIRHNEEWTFNQTISIKVLALMTSIFWLNYICQVFDMTKNMAIFCQK